jgi:DnaJ-class molecular chaperone
MLGSGYTKREGPMAKPEKIMKQCPTCKGKGVLPYSIAKQLPNPGKNIKCTRCGGKKFVFLPPKN